MPTSTYPIGRVGRRVSSRNVEFSQPLMDAMMACVDSHEGRRWVRSLFSGVLEHEQATSRSASPSTQFTDARRPRCSSVRTRSFTKLPLGDPHKETTRSRHRRGQPREVDAMVAKAVAAGGSHAVEPQDHGFMYGWSFYDLDGHQREVFWMDPSAINGDRARAAYGRRPTQKANGGSTTGIRRFSRWRHRRMTDAGGRLPEALLRA